jgi:hypothetical protein
MARADGNASSRLQTPAVSLGISLAYGLLAWMALLRLTLTRYPTLFNQLPEILTAEFALFSGLLNGLIFALSLTVVNSRIAARKNHTFGAAAARGALCGAITTALVCVLLLGGMVLAPEIRGLMDGTLGDPLKHPLQALQGITISTLLGLVDFLVAFAPAVGLAIPLGIIYGAAGGGILYLVRTKLDGPLAQP